MIKTPEKLPNLCSEEVVRQYRKPLEKQGYISRSRQNADERSLYAELTEEGKALKDKALKVPSEMEEFLQLPKEDIIHLKRILDRAVGLMWPEKP